MGRVLLKEQLVEAYRDDAKIRSLVGPGGIGKTTLANWLAAHVRDAGGTVAWVSGEQVAPNRESFHAGLRISGPSSLTDLGQLGRGAMRDLLVIDSFEKLTPLCTYILDDFLGLIGANLMVLLASRERLPVRLRNELGLSEVLVELDVEPLDEPAARELWLRAGGEEARADVAMRFARGFPLALRLLAEEHRDSPTLAGSPAPPEVLDALVESFVGNVPSPAHAEALYIAATVQTLHEPLLATLLDDRQRGAEMFAWLCRTSIVERTELGVSPHALVREVLFADLQHRDPALLERIQTRLVDAIAGRLASVDMTERHELLLQALYARRNVPTVKQYLALELAQRSETVPLSPGNLEEIRGHIQRHEGDESLRSFDLWCPRASFTQVIMTSAGTVGAFEIIIRVPREAGPDDLTDPMIAAAWRAWRESGATPEDGDLYLFRWFMETESYQGFTPAMTHIITLGPLFIVPSLEVKQIGFATSPPEQWAPLAPSFHLSWQRAHDFEWAGRRYGVFLGSPTAMMAPFVDTPDPVSNTLRGVLYHILGMTLPKEPLMRQPRQAKVSREEITRAVRLALLRIHEPQQLRTPALQLLVPTVAPNEIDRAVVKLLHDSIGRLAAVPSSARFAEILRATYVRPTTKQQAAALELGLPYGTYRYQLRKAVSLLEEEIWQWFESSPL